jgi:hypothetical protein
MMLGLLVYAVNAMVLHGMQRIRRKYKSVKKSGMKIIVIGK